jgi:membrane-bound inhibitor of C-type lysozyme
MLKSTPLLPCAARASLALLALLAVAACQRQQPPHEASPATESAPTAPAATTDSGPAAAPDSNSAAATTAAGTSDTPPEGVLRAYAWECEDGQKPVMRNLFREKAIAIDFHEGTKRLEQTPSASGARYSDGSIVFWTKGSTATLERPGAAPVQCTERRADSLREDARARGVAYRATGNEPGWVLEIGPGQRLEWVTNWGSERHAFDDATLSAGAKPQSRVYSAGTGAEAIRVTVTEEPCTDDAGVTFAHSAVVEFGGKSLRGCGVKLLTE